MSGSTEHGNPHIVSAAADAPIEASAEPAADEVDDYHSLIKDTERSRGAADLGEFKAETRQLLDIVAKSLYSNREVFIRELVSNASDALERLRYLRATGQLGEAAGADADVQRPLEIHIATDETAKTFTILDTGVGMTRAEMITNLGTIARSGSKEFLKQQSGADAGGGSAKADIIGQFGVGFYSSFMVSDAVEVFSQGSEPGSAANHWQSDGAGAYELREAEGVAPGTKIVLRLRGDAEEFSRAATVEAVLRRYSSFVSAPIFLNGKRVNALQPLWLRNPKEVTPEEHEEFYRFQANTYDRPRYIINYRTEAPLDIRALFYVPERKPSLFEMSQEAMNDSDGSGVSLYSRRVMVLNKAQTILPKWLRFLKGVIDSEDVPLNLSRELLQSTSLIRKLSDVLTARVIKFFVDKAKKDPEGYKEFYKDYDLYLKEGIVMSQDQKTKEDIGQLLRFETSSLPAGETTSLAEYVSRMAPLKRRILFLSAPSRALAESSPYLENVAHDKVEVLFLYEPYDELVLMQLGQYQQKEMRSLESEAAPAAEQDQKDAEAAKTAEEESGGALSGLSAYVQASLGAKVKEVRLTRRLASHPCVLQVKEMGAVRHFLRTSLADKTEEERLKLMEAVLELNATHPLIVRLGALRHTDSRLADLLCQQLLDNAMTTAGLLQDPRSMVSRLNELLTLAVGGSSEPTPVVPEVLPEAELPDAASEKKDASSP